MGSLSRNKGKVFERWVARVFRELFGERVHRGWQARDGSDAPDVVNVPGWWPECKHHRKVNVRAALKQADEDKAKAGQSALRSVAICKDNRTEPIAVLHFDDFVALLKELEDYRSFAHHVKREVRGDTVSTANIMRSASGEDSKPEDWLPRCSTGSVVSGNCTLRSGHKGDHQFA